MGLTYNWKIKRCKGTPSEVIETKTLSVTEKSRLWIPLLDSKFISLISSLPLSVTKCSTHHARDKVPSLILLRGYCHLWPSCPGCMSAAAISQNTSSPLLCWDPEIQHIPSSSQPWPQPPGSPQSCPSKRFFSNYNHFSEWGQLNSTFILSQLFH